MMARIKRIPCRICEGMKRWHKEDGAICTTKDCPLDKQECLFCEGSGLMTESVEEDNV